MTIEEIVNQIGSPLDFRNQEIPDESGTLWSCAFVDATPTAVRILASVDTLDEIKANTKLDNLFLKDMGIRTSKASNDYQLYVLCIGKPVDYHFGM